MTAAKLRAKRRRVPLEIALEDKAVAWLEAHDGVWAIKVGMRGWPDRLVLVGNGHHFWVEFKRKSFGRLTPAQKRVLPKLKAAGEPLIVAKDLGTVMDAFYRVASYERIVLP